MDLETENQIAAILMREAADLRCQAEKGVHAYLHRPTVRARPNSRFLSATVFGVQQCESSSSRRHRDCSASPRSTRHKETDKSTGTYFRTCATSSKREIEDYFSSKDGGLKNEEVDEFLHSRVKRGRGAVGSRMDETGPYLPPLPSDSKGKPLTSPDIRMREHRVLGPEKPSSLKSQKSDEIGSDKGCWKKVNRIDSVSPKKHLSKKNKCQDKKKEKTSKHRCKSKNRKE